MSDEQQKKTKKIGIITFHFVNNFGGALQAYALQKVVSDECDAQTYIIDYRNWFIRLTDRIRLFPISTNIKEIVSGIFTMGQRYGRRKKFGMFIIDNCNRTEKFSSSEQLKKKTPDMDMFICGSDQIWNPIITMGVTPAYFLDFVDESKKRIAYAPSFGTDGVAPKYQNKISRYVNKLDCLSVREMSGQSFLKEATGREAERLIDPTFLLDKEEWAKMGKNDRKYKYILLYIMQRDKEVYEYAKKIKEEMGLPIVEISRYGFQPGFVDEVLVDVGPAEFLGLFRDAAYVCTNSYHGLAYSIIFEKEFCLIPCKRFTARINNLLDLLKIDTLDNSQSERSVYSERFDAKFVKDTIRREQEKAKAFLRESTKIEEVE